MVRLPVVAKSHKPLWAAVLLGLVACETAQSAPRGNDRPSDLTAASTAQARELGPHEAARDAETPTDAETSPANPVDKSASGTMRDASGAAGSPAAPVGTDGSGGAKPSSAMAASPAAAAQDGAPSTDASHDPGAAPDYAQLFPNDAVQRIDIEMTAEVRATMLANLSMLLGEPGTDQGAPPPDEMPAPQRSPTDLVGADPTYVPVTVRYGGQSWDHVAMRYKGNSSLASAWQQGIKKLGFRFDFDRYEEEYPEIRNQRFYGFREMTFASGDRDPSLIRDKLAQDLLAELKLPSARCAFYQVYVSAGDAPEYWGLYTMIEDPSDQMLQAQFGNSSGNLYKPEGPGADWTRFEQSAFSKKSNTKRPDWSDVIAAIEALHATRDDAQVWRSGLEQVFNVESFLRALAFSRSIGHWDSYGVLAHNYYLYGDPADQARLHWISWDHNLAWQPFSDLTIMMDEINEGWPLIRFLLDDPIYREQYKRALTRMFDTPLMQPDAFEARARALHRLVQPYVVGGDGVPGERAPYTFLADPEQFTKALDDPEAGLLTTAGNLRREVQSALAR